MPWQDWVFSVGGFLILASLIPTLRGDQKPALTTSIMTGALIAVFAVTMATLGLWLSAAANAGNAIAWGILAVQRYRTEKLAHNQDVIEQLEHEVIDVAIQGEDEHPGAHGAVPAAVEPRTP